MWSDRFLVVLIFALRQRGIVDDRVDIAILPRNVRRLIFICEIRSEQVKDLSAMQDHRKEC